MNFHYSWSRRLIREISKTNSTLDDGSAKERFKAGIGHKVSKRGFTFREGEVRKMWHLEARSMKKDTKEVAF